MKDGLQKEVEAQMKATILHKLGSHTSILSNISNNGNIYFGEKGEWHLCAQDERISKGKSIDSTTRTPLLIHLPSPQSKRAIYRNVSNS
jgi:hypothetical protein